MRRFQATQQADGGWCYEFKPRARGIDESTATMTCAGLLGLVAGHGLVAEAARDKDPKGKKDVGKDAQVRLALTALGTAIDHPVAKRKALGQPAVIPRVGGKAYYFLWSLERVAVALDLKSVGGKDWYEWGAEILLVNQQADGSWQGDYAKYAADTCFALLFLRRANLVRDLTAVLRGRLSDPGEVMLKTGGVGGEALLKSKRLKPAIEAVAKEKTGPVKDKPVPDTASGRLAKRLLEAAGRRGEVLRELREGKGVEYTEALAEAIPRLDGEGRKQAREALGLRLTRMKTTTLVKYLKDEDGEIRRAAALACAMKDSKEHVPELIGLLRDAEADVAQAARTALRTLSREDFGPAEDATKAEVDKAVAAWKAWWAKQRPE
jgi:hypothetical protein